MLDTYELNCERLAEVAAAHGLVLNPDAKRVRKVAGLMAKNFDKVGAWICPCKQEGDEPDPGRDVCCPCQAWLDEIGITGYCQCRLFFTRERAAQG